MVKRDVVAAKIDNASRRLDAAERIFQFEELAANEEKRDVATFYIFLAVQECIDIAAHWLADEGWRSPEEAGAMFEVLHAHGQLDAELVKGLRRAVGLRNRIAHNYGTVHGERIRDEFAPGVAVLRRFLQIAAENAGF